MIEKEVHLLLVEDEPALREVTAERLEEHGFRVVQAESGEEALERLADFAFDVIITDLRLPGINGTEVLQTTLDRGGPLPETRADFATFDVIGPRRSTPRSCRRHPCVRADNPSGDGLKVFVSHADVKIHGEGRAGSGASRYVRGERRRR